MMEFKVVIPARYASSRFPGKPLADLGGQPLIRHVWNKALASGANEVVIATDDTRIADACREFGARVCMTDPDCASGTDRIAQTAARMEWPEATCVVNVQGDEPLIPPPYIKRTAAALINDPEARVATLAAPIAELHEFLSPHLVKVVTDHAGHALYFSRAPIPWPRDALDDQGRPRDCSGALRHIGIYAYDVATLRALTELPPTPLERTEQLEQLRVLCEGWRIAVDVVDQAPPHGVDTPDDLARLAGGMQGQA